MEVEGAIVAESSRYTKTVAVLVGLSAVVAALLTVIESQSSRAEEHALLLGARLTAEASGVIPAAQSQGSFGFRASQDALAWQSRGTSRLIAASETTPAQFEMELPLGEATVAAGERLADIATTMAEVPAGEVDEYTQLVLREGQQRAARLVQMQNEQVDRAEAEGTRGNRAVLALSVLAVAAVLLGFAGAVGAGRSGALALVAGAVFLALSTGIGVFAVVG